MRIHTLRLCSAYYYDNQSRPVCKAQTNHMNGSDTYLSSYTFTGKKLKECHIHSSQNHHTGIREEKVYTYDGFDRLASKTYDTTASTGWLQRPMPSTGRATCHRRHIPMMLWAGLQRRVREHRRPP